LSTTEPIIIPIEGDPSDFVKDSAKVNAELDKMARGTKQASSANTGMAQASKSAALSVTDLRSAYMMAAEAVRIAGQVWQATGQEFVNYAEQVKNMSRSLGASAEETSRLIQVADDVRISYDALKMGIKNAQKEGIEPNIENLAKLSDAYLALPPGVERTQFAIEKFGSKAGPEMEKLLVRGGNAIRDYAKGIDDALIVTEDGIKAADEYQKSLDDFNDTVMALKVSIGRELLPVMTQMLQGLANTNEIRKEANRLMQEGIAKNREEALAMASATVKAANAQEDMANASQDSTLALDENSAALMDTKEAVKVAEDALKNYKDALEEVSRANQDAESFIQSYADFSKNYAEEHAAAMEQVRDAERELADATKE